MVMRLWNRLGPWPRQHQPRELSEAGRLSLQAWSRSLPRPTHKTKRGEEKNTRESPDNCTTESKDIKRLFIVFVYRPSRILSILCPGGCIVA